MLLRTPARRPICPPHSTLNPPSTSKTSMLALPAFIGHFVEMLHHPSAAFIQLLQLRPSLAERRFPFRAFPQLIQGLEEQEEFPHLLGRVIIKAFHKGMDFLAGGAISAAPQRPGRPRRSPCPTSPPPPPRPSERYVTRSGHA